MNIVRQWFRRHFSDPQVVILALFLVAGFLVVATMGDMLAPLLAGVVIAYLLEGVVQWLERRSLGRTPAVLLVFLTFVFFLLFLIFGLVPRLSSQITQLVQQLPEMVAKWQESLLQLPERYPGFVSDEQVRQLMAALRTELGAFGQKVLSLSVASLFGLITLLVYLVLVPVLVFFLLKDKRRILGWITQHLPRERALATEVWREVDVQIGNYVRGKVWEIFIVGGASYLTFKLMGLQYAVLLGTLVGLSVIVPYIGAAVVTLPVAVIAYFQWGWSADFAWVLFAYGLIQALDGNVLVPLLFSEVVNLHPVAIIVAVLVFGGLWGFWGVFFAIPLATLVQAVLRAWPRRESEPVPAASEALGGEVGQP
ncbi:AI-2E family transporter [Thiohalobacter sp. IOR34]|uniref:AI-2E family transporter n=1 Tax=Thiohalobacter sp. IOR34 TaxID=3057176 RepID=UPI0025B27233|nr:AI-2E family transporter [Thiohalobacter sp. IOR34]WJW76200.1 AI-2E family transporter [Thiohalobacter sp. IOR34]